MPNGFVLILECECSASGQLQFCRSKFVSYVVMLMKFLMGSVDDSLKRKNYVFETDIQEYLSDIN